METFQQYWPWITGGLIALGMVYFVLRKKAHFYTNLVKRELEDYAQSPQSAAPQSEAIIVPPLNLDDPAVVIQHKQAIWRDIQQCPTERRIEVLVHDLAKAQIDARFTKIYFALFGSQQRFLEALNTTHGRTTTTAAAQEFLQKQSETDARIKAHHFNDWVSYLAAEGFLTVGVDALTLTLVGQDFLVWTTRQHLPDRTYEGI